MLVLSRKVDEKVIISNPIDGWRVELNIVEIRGDKVRLGFTAPGHIAIHRHEVQILIDEKLKLHPSPSV